MYWCNDNGQSSSRTINTTKYAHRSCKTIFSFRSRSLTRVRSNLSLSSEDVTDAQYFSSGRHFGDAFVVPIFAASSLMK